MAAGAAAILAATQLAGCADEAWPPGVTTIPVTPEAPTPPPIGPIPPVAAPAPSGEAGSTPAPRRTGAPVLDAAAAGAAPAPLATALTAPTGPGPEQATERYRFGVQAALITPFASDLTATSGFPVNWSLGVHAAWRLASRHTLRARIEAAFYWSGREPGAAPGVRQAFTSQVSSLSLGADYLLRLGGEAGAFSVGAHLAAVRWAVHSRNTITDAAGASTAISSTTSSWRPSAGLLAEYRLTRQLSVEGRLAFGRYGPDALHANTASLGVLWDF